MSEQAKQLVAVTRQPTLNAGVGLVLAQLAEVEARQIPGSLAEARAYCLAQGAPEILLVEVETPQTLAADLAEQIRPGQDMHSEGPKALLRANTEAAQAAGVFGVPAFVVDGKVFWGLDSLPMLRAYLDGDAWFDGPGWNAVSQLPSGLPAKP